MTEATRAQLMNTGRRVFAQRGLDGARVDSIAKEAGVNKALINYHFRGKSGLYRSVVSETFQSLGNQLERILEATDDPAARLMGWPQGIWEFLEDHPEFAPLFLRELMSDRPALSAEEFRGVGRSFALLARTVSVGRKRGRIERVEPFPLGLLILGALLMAQISSPLRRSLEADLTRDQLAGARGAVLPLLQKMIADTLIEPSSGTWEAPGTGG